MKNKQRFTGLVGVYYYRRPNLIQRLIKAFKRALLSLSCIGCFTAAAQNIQPINTPAETMLTTYPNPTSSSSFITNSNNQEFKLFDIYGNYLQGGIVPSDSFELDLSEYPNGVYFVNLVDQYHKLTVLKILKR